MSFKINQPKIIAYLTITIIILIIGIIAYHFFNKNLFLPLLVGANVAFFVVYKTI